MSASALPAPAAPARKRSVVRSLLRLWPYVRPVRARLISAAGVAVLASCLGLVFPLVLKWIIDGPIATEDTAGVWLGGAVLLLVGGAEAVLFGLRRWLVARPLAGVEATMRADLYRHVQRLPVAFHDRWATGQLLSRGTGDLQQLRMFLAFPLTYLVVNGTTIAVGSAILLAQDWTLGLILLAPVVPLIFVCTAFERKYSQASRRAQDQMGDLTTVVEESVLGIRIIKGFGRHRSQAQTFRDLALRLRGTELRKARLLGRILGLIYGLPEVFLGFALVVGVLQVANGTITAGTLVAFMAIALALRWPIESIGFLLAMCNEAATATDRYFDVLHTRIPPETGKPATTAPTAGAPDQDGTGTGDGPPAAATVPDPHPDAPADGIRFTGVVFRYPDAPAGSRPVLDGIDLHIRTGETLALVGGTGCGKTSLTALVPRLHEVTSGRITLDGTDIATLAPHELRQRVALAFEDPTLFSATVRENVMMGMPDDPARTEETDRAALDRALRVCQAADFVAALPHGPDTEVGEQGMSLSGGQRQRLALARAVVGRPRFLVLDDPLSALDVHTEALVEAALREVLASTTALVVAHRPSTVLLADRAALLSGGRITAVGTHAELLRSSAEYRHLLTGEPRPDHHHDQDQEVPAR
ncbi:ABC transporter ATP-binding protein [Streptomyces sp. ACA25]|uniref:ABC transporter ATP-binding protein n=1 Tax=Streptomyces sp. ACA25 TaxID=3022596 RepID=UPI002307C767|nr:ABC transporter ATP-binding protein [Streptomyces sp. ACA25]MDB1088298.1 ABC transporter ATP-binding protein [Streptomyces sp. ACA25]